ncbi:hypothetical protein Pcinc_000579 [Petrolisthes cinctipes]|uniref:Uncharacterized protein n=1 Tax=Petrolisthes cinctipes TaxID=88211 RepID=A0AAE1L481_PETCI|nr:hypothetical protein Pcinc_000579 [Petrolisthes cinctipes]
MEADKEAEGTRQEDGDGWTVQRRRKKWDRDETKPTQKDKHHAWIRRCEAKISMIKQALPRTQQGMKPSTVARPAVDWCAATAAPARVETEAAASTTCPTGAGKATRPICSKRAAPVEPAPEPGTNSLFEIVRAVLAILGVVEDTVAIEAAISETQMNRKPVKPAQEETQPDKHGLTSTERAAIPIEKRGRPSLFG